jgi:hypothetical protein
LGHCHYRAVTSIPQGCHFRPRPESAFRVPEAVPALAPAVSRPSSTAQSPFARPFQNEGIASASCSHVGCASINCQLKGPRQIRIEVSSSLSAPTGRKTPKSRNYVRSTQRRPAPTRRLAQRRATGGGESLRKCDHNA